MAGRVGAGQRGAPAVADPFHVFRARPRQRRSDRVFDEENEQQTGPDHHVCDRKARVDHRRRQDFRDAFLGFGQQFQETNAKEQAAAEAVQRADDVIVQQTSPRGLQSKDIS